MNCAVPGVRAIALSKSLPTPKTHELFRVVVSVAVGAPEAALADLIAPIAPEPFVPDVSTLENVITVRDEITVCDSVAVAVTLVRTFGEKARQISLDPACALVRATRAQVSPAPVTPV